MSRTGKCKTGPSWLLFSKNGPASGRNRSKLQNVFQSRPVQQTIAETQIPGYTGEIIHIGIFSTDQKHFLTCIDKFSKFAIVQPIDSRAIVDIKTPILQLINLFPKIKTVYCDNERSITHKPYEPSEKIGMVYRSQMRPRCTALDVKFRDFIAPYRKSHVASR